MTEQLVKLKMLLGITDESQDSALAFLLETVQEMVLNYCGIETIPEGLKNTVVRMAADLYRSEGYGQAAAPMAAKSVKRGDVTVDYGESRTVAEITGGKSVLDDYKAQLQAYRKLRW